jgi:hypothetical protein
MQLPDTRHVVRDEKRNITYTVMAYRQMSEAEVTATVYNFIAMNRKKIKKNRSYVIYTTIGGRDPIGDDPRFY